MEEWNLKSMIEFILKTCYVINSWEQRYIYVNILFGMICDDIISLERKIKCEEHFDIIDEGVLVYYIYIKNVLLRTIQYK